MKDLKPHILVITETVMAPEHPGEDDLFAEREYSLTCPGVTDNCRAWFTCEVQHNPAELEDAYERPVVHNVEHRYIDDFVGWSTASDRCLYVGHDQMPDCAQWLDEKHGLAVGEHPVDVDYVGDGDIALVLLSEVAA